jgi:hypothetical protein
MSIFSALCEPEVVLLGHFALQQEISLSSKSLKRMGEDMMMQAPCQATQLQSIRQTYRF